MDPKVGSVARSLMTSLMRLSRQNFAVSPTKWVNSGWKSGFGRAFGPALPDP